MKKDPESLCLHILSCKWKRIGKSSTCA